MRLTFKREFGDLMLTGTYTFEEGNVYIEDVFVEGFDKSVFDILNPAIIVWLNGELVCEAMQYMEDIACEHKPKRKEEFA